MTISPKVIGSTLGAAALTALAAALLYLQTPDGQTLLGSLPMIAVVAINAFAGALGAAVVGYLKRDPLRDAGSRAEAAGAAQAPGEGTSRRLSNTPLADQEELPLRDLLLAEAEPEYQPKRALLED